MKKYKFIESGDVVSLGQTVCFNGMKIEISEKLITDNQELFKEITLPKYLKCIQSNYENYTVDKVYQHLDNYDGYPSIIKIIDDKGSVKHIGNWNREYLIANHNCFEPATEEEFNEYNKLAIIEEAKKLFPIGSKVSNVNLNRGCKFTITGNNFKWSGSEILIYNDSTLDGCSYTVRNLSGIWAKIIKPILITEDGAEIYDGDHYYTLDMIQGLGASISIINDSVIPYVAGRKYFNSRKAANEWVVNHFNKSLSVYENSLFEKNLPIKSVVDGIEVVSSRALFYNIMKHREPKLYWNKVMQLIADDLNGDWVVKDSCEKWMIGKRDLLNIQLLHIQMYILNHKKSLKKQ